MKNLISFVDFSKLDLRVGKIIEVGVPAGSDNVYRLKVDLGKDFGERIIFTGLKKTHEEEGLVGKLGIFVVNLEPKKMMGEEWGYF